ncbi:C69 family dipeptidase [Bacteroidales bacterium OttesenSCG-928-K03]|nr:C69 family dipeptidase [Odoribacter sp. OttesenSCG-928-L07]MDL2239288.1 C69 family dipeptidase [Bacteroidales bacterium OttesenSCG-928-L14]MDL2240675.1 C69 family dipeptidase [Bacteroidales bacterium OttesenSCG-928-K22]MDL2242806.1 C69 family dipeptidase [Bacteroidales bacterium OttesenSCG-928-K03]
MKKLFLTAIFTLLGFSTFCCTNFLITKGASADGSTMLTYAADSHTLYGELYHWPAADWPEGTMLDVYEWDTGKFLGQIPQIKHTYNVVGNINEHQLTISETTYGGLEQLESQSGAIMDYGSLIYITLQRAKTAREAIKVIAELMENYGYASSGESFSIADPDEVWIMELIGKGEGEKGAVWVARMIPDGMICGHANQARITTFPQSGNKSVITSEHLDDIMIKGVTTAYHKDVISFAKKKGFYKGKDADFSFCDTYAPLNFGAARGCEARVWAGFMKANKDAVAQYEDYARGDNLKNKMPLWIEPAKKLTVHDVMDMMRDHYEGTSMDMTLDIGAGPYACPYRWRPMGWEYNGKQYLHERATSTQQTGFSFVTQSRGWLPNPIGGVIWFGTDDTYTTCYVPIYCGITQTPICFREGNGSIIEYSPTSSFWITNMVTNFAYSRYSDMIVDIQKVQNRLEKTFEKDLIAFDKEVSKLYASNPTKAIEMITTFSGEKAQIMFDEWKDLFIFLTVKYIDGNIKIEEDGVFKTSGVNNRQPAWPKQPDYPEKWRKAIVDDCGDNIRKP